MKSWKKAFLFLICTLSIPLYAEYNHLNIPDSSEVRKNLKGNWFYAPLSEVRSNKPELYSSPDGTLFQVRLEENDYTYSIMVCPHAIMDVDVYSDSGKYTIQQDVYPNDIAGAWRVVKEKSSGKVSAIRYYFLRDGEVYLQFTSGANGRTSYADLVIYGNYAAHGVPVGVPFDQFYDASFEKAYNLTKKNIPWNYVITDVNSYNDIKQMIGMIESKLPEIIYKEDAMYDGNGDLVHISNGKPMIIEDQEDGKKYLSSAGFVKWISDGIVAPLAGSNLERDPLLEETVVLRDTGHLGVLEQSYSLNFSLDWVRNLSSGVISVYSGVTYMFNNSGVDVTDQPFSATQTLRGIENPIPFISDVGYKTELLHSLLYVLANKEDNTFFVGAIRESDRRKAPEVNVFNKCAAFFPYFDANGKFQCTVFMNAKKMSLEEFMYTYQDSFVYLTRQKATDRFFPE